MTKFMTLLGAMLLLAGNAQAVPINSPVPTNAFIVFDGLDWAWGSPCSFQGGCGDATLAFQGPLGWHTATETELALIPRDFASYFVFADANVPLGGTDPISGAYNGTNHVPGPMACATPYFSTAWSHCDYSDGASGLWAAPAAADFHEQLFVRAAVPEPTSLVVLTVGMLGFACARLPTRRKVG